MGETPAIRVGRGQGYATVTVAGEIDIATVARLRGRLFELAASGQPLIAVERQISSYPGNHFVITSRPHGFPGPVIAQADVLAVRPFTAEQVQLFLNRWYLAAERHAPGAVSKAQMRAVRIRASESAAGLLKLLRANPALYDLTVNPLQHLVGAAEPGRPGDAPGAGRET